MSDVRPVTRESFMHSWALANEHFECEYECSAALYEWSMLHANFVRCDEIDEDPS